MQELVLLYKDETVDYTLPFHRFSEWVVFRLPDPMLVLVMNLEVHAINIPKKAKTISLSFVYKGSGLSNYPFEGLTQTDIND